MANPPYFSVIKTTTEKLQEVLNGIDWLCRDTNPEIVKVEYVGGRDWVVLLRTGSARQSDVVLNVVKMADAESFQKMLSKRHADRRDGWLR